jgi:hypothetical protein
MGLDVAYKDKFFVSWDVTVTDGAKEGGTLK